MGFCRQMHDRIGPVAGEDARHGLPVGDIGDFQRVTRGIDELAQGRVGAGIGQLVEIDDALPGIQQMADDRDADETRRRR
jgi:hypothetical protein